MDRDTTLIPQCYHSDTTVIPQVRNNTEPIAARRGRDLCNDSQRAAFQITQDNCRIIITPWINQFLLQNQLRATH